MYEAATIKISGPGLVVNLPAAIIYDALKKAGYNVEMAEFDGQFQGDRDQNRDNWPASELVELERRTKEWVVKLDIHPLPWGG